MSEQNQCALDAYDEEQSALPDLLGLVMDAADARRHALNVLCSAGAVSEYERDTGVTVANNDGAAAYAEYKRLTDSNFRGDYKKRVKLCKACEKHGSCQKSIAHFKVI